MRYAVLTFILACVVLVGAITLGSSVAVSGVVGTQTVVPPTPGTAPATFGPTPEPTGQSTIPPTPGTAPATLGPTPEPTGQPTVVPTTVATTAPTVTPEPPLQALIRILIATLIAILEAFFGGLDTFQPTSAGSN